MLILYFQQIFRPPIDVYDVLIHLHPQKLARSHQAVDLAKGAMVPKYKPPAEAADKGVQSDLPVTDFDPAHLYLHELRVSISLMYLNMYFVK